MNRKRIPYGTKLPVHFFQAELADIREHTFAPDFANHAIVDDKSYEWIYRLTISKRFMMTQVQHGTQVSASLTVASTAVRNGGSL